MSLGKATSFTQRNCVGVCSFCTSNLCFHWEMLGVYTLANVERLWVTSPSAAGCPHLNN